ncbi:hypothetical protein PF004_g8218 [Phytophthora fragariae]|uniref:Uncharacterized protein n=1 Tax=Phytophthora fragariae TaxID=53985 RepID=A0A6G0P7B2_9STRA|nr:hypothetical protein PF004_g8218 [Phytophthora fragariae]
MISLGGSRVKTPRKGGHMKYAASSRTSQERGDQDAEVAEAKDSPGLSSSSNEATQTRGFDAQLTPEATQSPMLFGQTAAMTQQQHHLYRQSALMKQQAMVLQQIKYLQFMLVQQRQHQATHAQPNALHAGGRHLVDMGSRCKCDSSS